MIKAGSFSRLEVFEACKFRAKLQFIDRIPEPARPPLPNGKEYPNDRGTRIHEYAETYLRDPNLPVIAEMNAFRAEFQKLRELSLDGKVKGEELWCFDDTWSPCGDREWGRIWFRIKTDATVFVADDTAVVIDYKTGRRFGNEVKHAQQLQLYAMGTVRKYPEVKTVITELWYLDQDELATMTFRRDQAERFLKGWNERNRKMTECTSFPANPNRESCRFCPYGPKGTGDCKVGVQ